MPMYCVTYQFMDATVVRTFWVGVEALQFASECFARDWLPVKICHYNRELQVYIELPDWRNEVRKRFAADAI